MSTQAPQQPDWLVQTKLHPPLLREDVIHRPALLDALCRAVASYPLTLLSAPAGYGKTTLLADFGFRISDLGLGGTSGDQIRNSQSAIRNSLAWLTLDEEDNDPTRFLAYLIAALRGLNPACGTTAQAVLTSMPNPAAEVRRIIGVLVNDILETLPDPFVLILDDLHLITAPAIFVALDYLLERIPPQMHLVLSTRHDPPLALARLRARGRMVELRLADLRFTLDEATLLLNEKLDLDLSPGDLAALHERTEGWPVGLRLLASSLDRIPTAAGRTAFIESLAQTDRYVFDFLAAEVLNRQEPEVQTFLLETSILSELTAVLCQAVTGRSDAGLILEDLYRRNLFLMEIGGYTRAPPLVLSVVEGLPRPSAPLPTYRYHALFAAFLRRRLRQEMPARVAELHQRAAEAQEDPVRAVGHYLMAKMWEEAALTIEQVGHQLLRQGMLGTVSGWLRALPSAVMEAHPRLLYLQGICLWSSGDLVAAQRPLERALQGFEALGDEVGQGQVLADMASWALLRADFERSLELFNRALERPLSVHSRIQSLMGRAGVMLIRAEWSQALADFEAAERLAVSSADPKLLRLPLVRLSPIYAFLPGGMRRMEYVCHLARELIGDEVSPLRVTVEEYTALLHLWQGRPAEAVQAGELALSLQERLGGAFPFVGMDAAAIMLDAYVVLGDYAAAERCIEPMLRRIEQSPLAETMMAGFLFEAGRVYWLQGRLEEARQVYARMCAIENPREWPMAATFRARMEGMLALSEGRYADAERLFRLAIAVEDKERISLLWGGARIMLAYSHLLRGHHDKALASVEPLLAESKQRGLPCMIVSNGSVAVPVLRLAVERGVYASFASRLLDILGAGVEPRPVRVPETGETLTSREVEVLRLLAAGASNRSIAEKLVISEGTVKSHVHHILRKLDVASRSQAAARARRLRIV